MFGKKTGKFNSHKELKKSAKAGTKEEAKRSVRALEREADMNRRWASETSGGEKKQHQAWAGEDAAAAAQLRRKYGI